MKITSISEISEKEEFNERDRSGREFNIKSHLIIHAYIKSNDLLQGQGVEKWRQPQKQKTTSKIEDDLKKLRRPQKIKMTLKN